MTQESQQEQQLRQKRKNKFFNDMAVVVSVIMSLATIFLAGYIIFTEVSPAKVETIIITTTPLPTKYQENPYMILTAQVEVAATLTAQADDNSESDIALAQMLINARGTAQSEIAQQVTAEAIVAANDAAKKTIQAQELASSYSVAYADAYATIEVKMKETIDAYNVERDNLVNLRVLGTIAAIEKSQPRSTGAPNELPQTNTQQNWMDGVLLPLGVMGGAATAFVVGWAMTMRQRRLDEERRLRAKRRSKPTSAANLPATPTVMTCSCRDGYVVCPDCKGAGRLNYETINTSGEKSTSNEKCLTCLGSGYIKCQICNGQGYYITEKVVKPESE